MSPSPRELPFKLLVVDDEEFVRETLALYLASEGCEVATASRGEDAIALLEETEFEAAIVDIRMPGMDGLTLLSELKTRAPDLEVLMSTGFQSLETAVEAMRRGACDYITKPITHLERDFFRFVTRAVERRRLRLSNRALSAGLQRALDELGGAQGRWERHLGILDALAQFGRRGLAAHCADDLLHATEDLLPVIAPEIEAAFFWTDPTSGQRCGFQIGESVSNSPPALPENSDGRPRWIEGEETDPSSEENPLLWFPLAIDGAIRGWIAARPQNGTAWTEAQRLVLRTFADSFSLCLGSQFGPRDRSTAKPTTTS